MMVIGLISLKSSAVQCMPNDVVIIKSIYLMHIRSTSRVIFSCYSSIPLSRSDVFMTTHSGVSLFFLKILHE